MEQKLSLLEKSISALPLGEFYQLEKKGSPQWVGIAGVSNSLSEIEVIIEDILGEPLKETHSHKEADYRISRYKKIDINKTELVPTEPRYFKKAS